MPRRSNVRRRPYVVVSVNKSGALSKMRPHDLDFASTYADAVRIKERLEGLNPGRRFAIVDNPDHVEDNSGIFRKN